MKRGVQLTISGAFAAFLLSSSVAGHGQTTASKPNITKQAVVAKPALLQKPGIQNAAIAKPAPIPARPVLQKPALPQANLPSGAPKLTPPPVSPVPSNNAK